MRWRRTDPVQTVVALIAIGESAAEGVAAALMGKPDLFRALPVEHGEGWAALFAAPVPDSDDAVLPHLAGAVPLYLAAPGLWLPVGVALAVPDHARDALLQAMFEHHRVAPPAIVVPRFAGDGEEAGEADLYLIRQPIAFHRSALAMRGAAA